ncbi:MAG: DUF4912 domain-containing protein [Planctomycetia bacterium]|nr:DUF4912 domain-containing protein [Planctomycetia bacterium]
MTAANLKEKPVRDLARMAKQHGVAGWHSMRKDQLIRALVRKAKLHRSPQAGEVRQLEKTRDREAAAKAARDAAITQRIEEARARLLRVKSLATPPEGGKPRQAVRDRMVVMVRGPHWLHAFWEVSPRSIARAEAALGQDWHAARPVLRLLQLENGLQGSPSERVVRTIEVHGGVKNWFVDIREPMRCRLEIGYLTAAGRLHALARSNAVSTPAGIPADTLDAHWADIAADCEKIYAMSGGFSPENNSTELQELFEERLRRPMGPPAARTTCADGEDQDRVSDFQLEVDAEMIVYGATQPGSYVTLQGEPVKVQPDGTFRVRVDLPNKRQVLPIIASTADGVERQTVVLAVERNTKSMEPLGRDAGDF